MSGGEPGLKPAANDDQKRSVAEHPRSHRGLMEALYGGADLERYRDQLDAIMSMPVGQMLLTALDTEKERVRIANERADAADEKLAKRMKSGKRLVRHLIARTRASEAASEKDHDTGLSNKLGIESYLKNILEPAVTDGTPFVLMFCDADGLKATNDQCGHAAGDELIQAVATTLKTTFRGSDLLGRYGGDEFVVALPATEINDAITLAQKFFDQIGEKSRLFQEKYGIGFGVSMGVMGSQNHGMRTQSPQQLMTWSDAAMYHSKEQGKGLITVVDPNCLHQSQEESILRFVRPDALFRQFKAIEARRKKDNEAPITESIT